MSDKHISRKELTQKNQKINKRRKNIRALLIVVITAALVYATGLYGASLAYFGDFISSGLVLVQFGEGWPVEGEFSQLIQAQTMGQSLCTLDADNFSVYSPTAKKVFTYSHSMQNPVMETSGKRAVIYNLNQTTLKIANSHKILFQKEMPNNIIHAAISKSNKVAVTTKSSSYNGEVTVFNYDMQESFVWYCAKDFPVYSVLSDDGKTLAVTAIQTNSGKLESSIYIIDISAGEEKYTLSGTDYPLKLMFMGSDKLLIAYSDRLVLWSISQNSQLAQYEFQGDNLIAMDYDSPYIAIVTGSYSHVGNAKISFLSDTLEEKFSDTIDESAKGICLSQSRAYVLAQENIYEYNYKGEKLSTTAASPFSKKILAYSGTILIDSTSIQKVEKTKK